MLRQEAENNKLYPCANKKIFGLSAILCYFKRKGAEVQGENPRTADHRGQIQAAPSRLIRLRKHINPAVCRAALVHTSNAIRYAAVDGIHTFFALFEIKLHPIVLANFMD
ncbi:hypothetical protein [Catalinimonas alkaloidigena]|uniref:hypothetical protein n=1 Tax=Catalinimonas alkaloidigena TaxID=1075417 RepID=UPI000B7C62D2|nr:hypothetical protein [Catalinimonas alkaloidigena]